MRILRLKLRHFRGIDECEVRFAPAGVTVVEGENEAGKSSLGMALDALFEHLDSSKKQHIMALKPVHRDEGSEIEADVETGPYAFTYFKRFHKRPETTLRITRPRPENLTGRDAHERAMSILNETIDFALWKALRIEQGAELAPFDLEGQTRLSRALDAAAGSARAGDREETLFEAARTEFLRYFTDGGAERKELKTKDEQLAAEIRRRDELGGKLRELESDVQQSATLKRDHASLEKKAGELTESAARYQVTLDSLARIETEVEAARARASESGLLSKAADEALAARRNLEAEVESRRLAHAELVEGLELAAPAKARAACDLADAEAAADSAQRALNEAEGVLAVRRMDRTFRHEENDLEQLRERKERIAAAQADLESAEKTLAGPKITDKVLQEISGASVEVEKARAALAAGSPRVTLVARKDFAATLDGKVLSLSKGETRDLTVERSLVLEVPNVADLAVSAGGSAGELRDVVAKAERELVRRLDLAGVSNVVEAASVRDARREAERIAKERKRLIEDNLRDLSLTELAAKIARLLERVGTYPATRPKEPPLPADLTDAKSSEASAEAVADTARRASEDAAKKRNSASRRSHDLELLLVTDQEKLRRAASDLDHARMRLESMRGEMSDEKLEVASREAKSNHESTRTALEAVESRLAAASPDETRQLAANARAAAEGARNRLDALAKELAQVSGRLQVSGEEGLAEARDAAAATCARLEAELSRERARAAAAKLLFDTLDEARQKAHLAYVAPLREQIEKLGRLVFGPMLGLDLDDSLRLVSRTLDGVTVPFESLSGGTREQLGILARLACAILVAKDGGAPVILDDALGYTDTSRLEAMGAALAQAGRSCQVIVLTCMPDRYARVGGAHVVKLAPV